VIVVPLAKAIGLGSVIGYLAAGILIGPSCIGWVDNPQTVLQIAEFGVVLMLFLIGLELEPQKLWALRRPIFGWGMAQVLLCAGGLAGIAFAAGAPWRWAVVGGLGLALSSTAIVLQTMSERNLLPTTAGQAAFSILLFQDIAAIPILALIPLLGVMPADSSDDNTWREVAKAIGMIAAIIVGGRLLLRHALRWIARQGTPEIFTAASLGLVLGIAALMQAVGLSMALGAFLGGVLLAESEYRRELETDVEPFKGLLLGLFFMAVGMSVDFHTLAAHPMLTAALVIGFVALKWLLIWGLSKAMALPRQERPVFALLLAQGGEFAFVVFQQATGAQVFSSEVSSVLIGAVALSMLLAPLVLGFLDRWICPRYGQAATANPNAPAILDTAQDAPILICGFGRYGQIVGRMLYANGLKTTVLDHDAEAIEALRSFGFRVHYGDATRLDLLRIAGAAQARVIVVAVDDVEQSLKIVDIARQHFPQAALVVRARNMTHYYDLRDRGVTHIDREVFESSLVSAQRVLTEMGWEAQHIQTMTTRFRQHNLELIETTWPHRKDRTQLIALAKQGRQQLEELFARERAENNARQSQSP
jgi:glutathione-regulated potassium-efflux system ancillary protein KefC